MCDSTRAHPDQHWDTDWIHELPLAARSNRSPREPARGQLLSDRGAPAASWGPQLCTLRGLTSAPLHAALKFELSPHTQQMCGETHMSKVSRSDWLSRCQSKQAETCFLGITTWRFPPSDQQLECWACSHSMWEAILQQVPAQGHPSMGKAIALPTLGPARSRAAMEPSHRTGKQYLTANIPSTCCAAAGSEDLWGGYDVGGTRTLGALGCRRH